jgi:hypothetical protein
MTSRPNSLFLKLICLPLCLSALLQACAAARPKPADTAGINDRSVSAVIKQSQMTFAEQNPVMASRMGALELTIRMATPAEIPEEMH